MRNAEVIRQWQILREIEARRVGVTIHELAGQVKVSTRTIRRDLQALQEAGFAVFDEGEEQETKRWKLDEVVTNTGKPSELYYIVRTRKSVEGDALLTAIRSSGNGTIDSANIEIGDAMAIEAGEERRERKKQETPA